MRTIVGWEYAARGWFRRRLILMAVEAVFEYGPAAQTRRRHYESRPARVRDIPLMRLPPTLGIRLRGRHLQAMMRRGGAWVPARPADLRDPRLPVPKPAPAGWAMVRIEA